MPVKRLTDALATATAGWGVIILVGEGRNALSTVIVGHSPVDSHIPGAHSSLEETHVEHFHDGDYTAANTALQEAVKLAGKRLSQPTILGRYQGVSGKEYHYLVLDYPEAQN